MIIFKNIISSLNKDLKLRLPFLNTYPKEDCILRIWLTWHSVCVIWQSGLTLYPFSSMYFSYSDFENVTGDSNDIDNLFFASGEANKTSWSSGIVYLTNMLLITPSDRSLSLRDIDATVSSPFGYNLKIMSNMSLKKCGLFFVSVLSQLYSIKAYLWNPMQCKFCSSIPHQFGIL